MAAVGVKVLISFTGLLSTTTVNLSPSNG